MFSSMCDAAYVQARKNVLAVESYRKEVKYRRSAPVVDHSARWINRLQYRILVNGHNCEYSEIYSLSQH